MFQGGKGGVKEVSDHSHLARARDLERGVSAFRSRARHSLAFSVGGSAGGFREHGLHSY